jgi:hypothetical protein
MAVATNSVSRRLGQAKRRPNTGRNRDLCWVIADARPNLLGGLGAARRLPLHRRPAHVIREPLGIGAELGAAVGEHARGGAARGQAEHVHAHGHAAGVAIADLDVAIDHHG